MPATALSDPGALLVLLPLVSALLDSSGCFWVTVHGSRRFGADFPAILAVTALTR